MPIITVKNLTKSFEYEKRATGFVNTVKNLFHRKTYTLDAVKNIFFEIAQGEFIGFVGPNGAGKTTTLKMLSGILHPTSGEVSVLGHVPWKREPTFQKQFSLVMGQKNQLWWDLPAIESFEFNRAVYEIPTKVYEHQKNRLVELLNIEGVLETPVRKLSLGERMKCELAAALLHKPSVLFLDEPTIGLDVVSQKNIRDFLTHYNREEGATIILTSHYMEDIRRLCDRVIIIDHGVIIYDGAYRDLVERYADTKTIEMTFGEKIERRDLEKFGTLTEYREGFGKLIVARNRVTEVTTAVLKELPIDDISIHEESMEEIVREIFGAENQKSKIKN